MGLTEYEVEASLSRKVKGLKGLIADLSKTKGTSYTLLVQNQKKLEARLSTEFGFGERVKLTNKVYRTVSSHMRDVNKYFDKNISKILALRDGYEGYPEMPTEEREVVAEECKKLFLEFREALGDDDGPYEAPSNSVLKELRTDKPTEVISLIAEAERINSRKGKGKGPEKQKSMAQRFDTCYGQYLTYDVWDEEIISTTDKDSLKNFCFAFLAQGGTLDKDAVGGLHRKFIVMRDDFYLKKVLDQSRSTNDEQMSNLDRLWHCMFKLYQTGFLTTKNFKKMKQFADVIKVGFINQKIISTITGNSTNEMISGLTFDRIADGGEFHRFQHPFMVTEKRFGNGLACFSMIINIGQLLNALIEREECIELIIQLNATEVAIKNLESELMGLTDEEKAIYISTRLTLWLLHQTLKGVTSCVQWSGLLTGNALKAEILQKKRTGGAGGGVGSGGSGGAGPEPGKGKPKMSHWESYKAKTPGSMNYSRSAPLSSEDDEPKDKGKGKRSTKKTKDGSDSASEYEEWPEADGIDRLYGSLSRGYQKRRNSDSDSDSRSGRSKERRYKREDAPKYTPRKSKKDSERDDKKSRDDSERRDKEERRERREREEEKERKKEKEREREKREKREEKEKRDRKEKREKREEEDVEDEESDHDSEELEKIKEKKKRQEKKEEKERRDKKEKRDKEKEKEKEKKEKEKRDKKDKEDEDTTSSEEDEDKLTNFSVGDSIKFMKKIASETAKNMNDAVIQIKEIKEYELLNTEKMNTMSDEEIAKKDQFEKDNFDSFTSKVTNSYMLENRLHILKDLGESIKNKMNEDSKTIATYVNSGANEISSKYLFTIDSLNLSRSKEEETQAIVGFLSAGYGRDEMNVLIECLYPGTIRHFNDFFEEHTENTFLMGNPDKLNEKVRYAKLLPTLKAIFSPSG